MRVKKLNKHHLTLQIKLLAIFISVLFYYVPAYALIISEINFDPAGSDTDREWIEIYNDSGSSVDLTTYKFFENNTNHGIDALTGDKNILSGEYVVLVQNLDKFKNDNPVYIGKIFKSSFSLSNTGESLSLKDSSGSVINTVSYLQATTGAKDGETISFDGTSFIKTAASPGSGSIATINNTTTTSTSTNTTSTEITATTTIATNTTVSAPIYYYRSYFPEAEKIYVYAGENKVALSGAQVSFEAKAVNGEKKVLSGATFFWSFGDGGTAEGKTATHTYKYPGEYTVNVEGYDSGARSDDKIYVLVTDPDIKIKINFKNGEKVVEINNTSSNEVDIGGFLIKSSGGETEYTSTMPKKLLILPKRTLILSQETLKFATGTTFVSLAYNNGKQISEYNLSQSDKINSNYIKKPISTNATTTGVKVFTKEEYDKNKSGLNASSTQKMVNQNLKKKVVLVNIATSSKPQIKNLGQKNENVFVITPNDKSIVSNFLDLFR